MEEELKAIIAEAQSNLDNPGNEDDTLQQIIDRAEYCLTLIDRRIGF
jgi:hypothetical protein